MKILSLFDGISCAQVSINNIGIKNYVYYASEIDKHAISITQKNYPNTIQVGNILSLKGENFSDIDLMIGGSPCQDLSIAGKREGLQGKKSILFWEFVRLLEEIKPKYFVMENVYSMSDENKKIITETLGKYLYPDNEWNIIDYKNSTVKFQNKIDPQIIKEFKSICIDAALVSAQRRKRLFWTNIPNVTLPEQQNIFVKDILLDNSMIEDKHIVHRDDYTIIKDFNTPANPKNITQSINVGKFGKGAQGYRIYGINGKSVTLTTRTGGTGLYAIDMNGKIIIRKLTPIESERLQCLPDNYTLMDNVPESQRYKMIGNGFCVKVIEHILKHIVNEQELIV